VKRYVVYFAPYSLNWDIPKGYYKAKSAASARMKAVLVLREIGYIHRGEWAHGIRVKEAQP